MSSLLGDLVRQKRELKGWSQEQLAEKVGVERRTIQRIESGETPTPQPYTLRKIAKELGITNEELDSVNKRGRVKESTTTSHMVYLPSGENEPITPVKEENTERAAFFAPTSTGASEIALDSTPVTLIEEGKSEETVPFTSTQAETSEAPIQFARTDRKQQPNWLVLNLTLITIAILATFGIVFWALIGKNMYNTISGQVTCPNNQPVTAVWIVDENGDGKYVNKQLVNGNESVVRFRYTLPNGGGYNVHTGCGFLPSGQWAKSYRTERCSGTIEDRDFHALTVYEQPPADKSQPCLARDAKSKRGRVGSTLNDVALPICKV